jgi:chemotaxis protein methyltransferase CheR
MQPDDAAPGAARPRRPPIARQPLVIPALASLPLAQGELGSGEAEELRLLKEQIRQSVGFACEGYKERCLRRRIAVRMRARAVHTYGDYARLLEGDAEEYDRLVAALTINVSKFFRNPEVWEAARRSVLPELFALGEAEIRAWSAGTANGEEAYTLSILGQEYAAEQGLPGRLSVLGTDIDRDSLERAARAEYTDFAMTDIHPTCRDRWFDQGGSYRLRSAGRRDVRFGVLDLIQDEYPREQHLICCRNVIIYFERAVQEDLFRRFHESLVPGGYLILGKVEALFGATARLFETVAGRERIFRKR